MVWAQVPRPRSQIGFTAASDNHLSQPGYTAPKGKGLSQRGGLGAVLGAELTRDELFDNMRQRLTYATTGDRIILQTNVNGLEMGQYGVSKPRARQWPCGGTAR